MDSQPKHSEYRQTGDLALAAYAHMKGMKIIKAEECRNGRAIEYQFLIHDPKTSWEQLCIDFTNSEAAQHDGSVRMLKRLCKRAAPN